MKRGTLAQTRSAEQHCLVRSYDFALKPAVADAPQALPVNLAQAAEQQRVLHDSQPSYAYGTCRFEPGARIVRSAGVNHLIEVRQRLIQPRRDHGYQPVIIATGHTDKQEDETPFADRKVGVWKSQQGDLSWPPQRITPTIPGGRSGRSLPLRLPGRAWRRRGNAMTRQALLGDPDLGCARTR